MSWSEYMQREGWKEYLPPEAAPIVEAKIAEALAAETERCAKIAESVGPAWEHCGSQIAAAIRARGEKP